METKIRLLPLREAQTIAFNEYHPDPHMPEQFLDKPSGRAERDQEDGLFKFEKRMKEI